MFTGIVEEIGTLKRIVWGTHSAALTIQADRVLSDAAVGDSIAVNGICLTVTSLGNAAFTADVMHAEPFLLKRGKARHACEPGACYGSRRTVRRPHCERPR